MYSVIRRIMVIDPRRINPTTPETKEETESEETESIEVESEEFTQKKTLKFRN